jgi:hypothetical protein
MVTLANFVAHHAFWVNVCMVTLIIANTIGITLYKKRHSNQLPQGKTKAILIIGYGLAAVFGCFVVGVLSARG